MKTIRYTVPVTNFTIYILKYSSPSKLTDLITLGFDDGLINTFIFFCVCVTLCNVITTETHTLNLIYQERK